MDFAALAERYDVSGGTIMNVIRYAALRSLVRGDRKLRAEMLTTACVASCKRRAGASSPATQAARRVKPRPAPPVPAAAFKVAQSAAGVARVQCQSLRVSSRGDAAEVEACRVASNVVHMPARMFSARAMLPAGALSRAPLAKAGLAARPALISAPLGIPTGGQTLGAEVRKFMEPRFGASFGGVRIHTDDTAAHLSQQMQARAFTVGNQIFFGSGQFLLDSSEGRELIAHELTHTLQQGAATQQPSIQRSFLGDLGLPELPDPKSYIAGKASSIRGFDFMTVVIGKNPITDAKADDSPANLLRQATRSCLAAATLPRHSTITASSTRPASGSAANSRR